MKILKKYLLMLMCLYSSIVLASDDISQREKQLATVTGQPRIDILNELANFYEESAPQKSIEYGKEAFELATVASNQPVIAMVLNQLGVAFINAGDYDNALNSLLKSLAVREQIGDNKAVAETFINLGITYWRLSDYEKALDYCFKALRLYEAVNYSEGIAKAWHNLGIIYDIMKDHDKGLEFLLKALRLREVLGNKEAIADSLNNIGIVYYYSGEYQKALEYYSKSLEIQKQINNQKGIAKSLNNIGFVYNDMKKYDEALKYFTESLKIWQEIQNSFEVANVSNNIGKVYIALQQYAKADFYLRQGQVWAQKKGLKSKDFLSENYELFSNLYAAQGDYKKALEFYKDSADLISEIFKEKIQKIASIQTRYETEKKQQEIELLKKENDIKQLQLARQQLRQNSLLSGFGLVIVLAFVLYRLYRLTKKANFVLAEAHAAIKIEKEKADKLLLNILPYRIANDLKEKHYTEPESFENVTVYFSDVVGFTKLASHLEPKALIDELNEIFTAFDNIIEQNHGERIKTIGDAYLCVCGMPEPNPHHAQNMVRSAIQIVHYLTERNQHTSLKWQIRIGIHTGSVVGGVVGIKKYIYDVFGDTINTASRMESHSQPMKINISESTYQLIKDEFSVVDRGMFSVKGKGEMKMYFVEPDLSEVPPIHHLNQDE